MSFTTGAMAVFIEWIEGLKKERENYQPWYKKVIDYYRTRRRIRKLLSKKCDWNKEVENV